MIRYPYATSKLEQLDRVAVNRVLDRNYLTRGVEMQALEERMCDISGKKYAVAMCNATVALWAVVKALSLNKLWTSTLTYSAIGNAAALSHQPYIRFVDVDVDTLCGVMPETWNGVDDAIYAPMDYAGYPSLERPIPGAWKGDGLTYSGSFTLLDAAHSIGGKLADGKSNTYYADAAVYSLHPCKPITSGEGGIVVTDDQNLMLELKQFRNNGFRPGTHTQTGVGINGHMPELSCALGLSQSLRLNSLIATRHAIAQVYYSHWQNDLRVILPAYHSGHVFHLYVIRLSEAVDCDIETFRAELEKVGVGTQRHYRPLHTQPVYRVTDDINYPIAQHAYNRMISIPMYVGLELNDIRFITNSIDRLLDKYATR